MLHAAGFIIGIKYISDNGIACALSRSIPYEKANGELSLHIIKCVCRHYEQLE